MKKKAVLVSCFNYYDNRLSYIKKLLEDKGYSVDYITSDFDHISKQKYIISSSDTTQLKVPKYKKNLSIQRLYSHYIFGRKLLDKLNVLKPELLYVMLPPNYLAQVASIYKNNNPTTKIIFDVYDLWPETFPSMKSKKKFYVPFYLWSELRNKNLRKANKILLECKLYESKLGDLIENADTDVLYLTKKSLEAIPDFLIDEKTLDLCYLGSINNIIDIKTISEFLIKLNKLKKVRLHIIGDGEKKDELISNLINGGVEVEFYGKVFDENVKSEIFSKCAFGINVMKSTVCVGLTMKSVDYFQGNLPIINNIKGDTFSLVEKYGIGFNIVSNLSIDDMVQEISKLSYEDLIKMRRNTREVFEKYFSTSAFQKKIETIFKDIS